MLPLAANVTPSDFSLKSGERSGLTATKKMIGLVPWSGVSKLCEEIFNKKRLRRNGSVNECIREERNLESRWNLKEIR